MTLKEKVAMEEPDNINIKSFGGVLYCPFDYSYLPKGMALCSKEGVAEDGHDNEQCTRCWNQEIPGTEPVNEEVHCRAEKIDFEVAYEDLKVEHEKLMKDYEDLNTMVAHQRSHIQRMQDENAFLRACVMKAVGGNKNDT